MKWDTIDILDDNGVPVKAQTPVIVSASRATDIPTFYADWFVERWKKGHVRWKNPFNGVSSWISFKKTRLVVFWTKNPKPMLKHINFLDENVKNYYFHFTLNDYDKERLEEKVPNVISRIDTFIDLSERIGKDKVVWRFDPLILTDSIGIDELLKKVEYVGDRLFSHTSQLVFSFADIGSYQKVIRNLQEGGVRYKEFTPPLMIEFAQELRKLNEKWNLKLSTCCEQIDLSQQKIEKNKCVDDELISRLFSSDSLLMQLLGLDNSQYSLFGHHSISGSPRNLKDKGQRSGCGCIVSKDIGSYNTCPHNCVYCYANSSKETAFENYKLFLSNAKGETII